MVLLSAIRCWLGFVSFARGGGLGSVCWVVCCSCVGVGVWFVGLLFWWLWGGGWVWVCVFWVLWGGWWWGLGFSVFGGCVGGGVGCSFGGLVVCGVWGGCVVGGGFGVVGGVVGVGAGTAEAPQTPEGGSGGGVGG
ncbi:hypothetical protein RA272_27915, partial [Pseudomonas syringae pv. tagetis]